MDEKLGELRNLLAQHDSAETYLDRLSISDKMFGSVIPCLLDVLEVINALPETNDDVKFKVNEALEGAL